jgi:GTP-binding protein
MTRVRAEFVTSAAAPSDFPAPTLRELAVVGRSNVGKSSLINALTGNSHLARTSRTPGRTRLVNWFEVTGAHPFFLVDLPGYGYAKVPGEMKASWKPLIETYLSARTSLAGVLLLVDIRRGPEVEELDFVPWLLGREISVIVALTKADKLPKNKRMLEIGRARRELGLRRDPYAASTVSGEGIEELWRAVVGLAAPPKP